MVKSVTVARAGRVQGRIVREFGMDTHTLLYLNWITNTVPQGTLLTVMWQPGQEGCLGERGHMNMYG